MLISLAQGADDERVRLQATLAIIERTDGKVRDVVDINPPLSDEEMAEELEIIVKERLEAMSIDERRRLLLSDPAPSDTIQ